MNPLDAVDIIFKDEGLFFTVGAETETGLAFMKRAGLLSELRSQPEAENSAHPDTASVSVKEARALMRRAQAAGLSVFEF